MKQFLILVVATIAPITAKAVIINYEFEFAAQAFENDVLFDDYREGTGKFTVNTRTRKTTYIQMNSNRYGQLLSWQGSQAFNEFKEWHPGEFVEGGLGSFSADGFFLSTIFWLTNVPENADPFEFLTHHAPSEDFWHLDQLGTARSYGVVTRVTKASIVPEPSSLALTIPAFMLLFFRRQIRSRWRELNLSRFIQGHSNIDR